MDVIAVMVVLARPVNVKTVTAKKRNKNLQQTTTKMTTVNHVEHKCHLNLKNKKSFYGLKNLR